MAVERPALVGLRALGLGDLLTGVPALRALAAGFPDHVRVLAAPTALAPLAELIRMPDRTPALHGVNDTTGLVPLAAELEDRDVAVNLHGRGPQSHRILLAARPARLVAFACEEAGVTGPQWRAGEHEVLRWCRMLSESDIAADPDDLAIEPPDPATVDPALLDAAAGATVIHPGAASASRRWPAARFATVARDELAAGKKVVVTGGPDEVDRARLVARGAGLPEEAVLAGRTDLTGLAGVVAAAARVLCGDTGVAHLATALGTPSVILFGPTSPDEWGPRPRDRHRVLWTGRLGDPHAGEPDAGLLELTEKDVIDELAALDEALRTASAETA